MSDTLVIILTLIFFIVVPPVSIALFRKQKDSFLDPETIESMSINPDLVAFEEESLSEEESEPEVSVEAEIEPEPPKYKFSRKTNPKHHFK
ncbi:MAG: hypothetical protein LCH52_02255 [Bacteroidetes bacterium]|nr:hypothetical protein [Bacteroidota bacterium]